MSNKISPDPLFYALSEGNSMNVSEVYHSMGESGYRQWKPAGKAHITQQGCTILHCKKMHPSSFSHQYCIP